MDIDVHDVSISSLQLTGDKKRRAARHKAIDIALGSKAGHKFFGMLTSQHRSRGQILLDLNFQHDVLAIVCSGVVKLVSQLADGRQQIVRFLYQSDAVWRRHGCDGGLFLEAATEVDICYFSGDRFEAALKADASARRTILDRALLELDQARNRLVVLGQMTAMEKLTNLLIEQSTQVAEHVSMSEFRGSNFPVMVLSLSRQDIADYLGIRIETVSRCITELKFGGHIRLIDYRTIEICHPDCIQEIAECHGRNTGSGASRKSVTMVAP